MVTNDEKRMAQALVGVYKVVRLQQQAISHLMIGIDALRETQDVPDKYFKESYAKLSASPRAEWLQKTLHSIDATILSLETAYGPGNR